MSSIILLITIGSLLILSFSINSTNEKNNRFNSTKSFQQKHKALEAELYRLDQYQKSLQQLIEKTQPKQLPTAFETITQLNQSNGLFQNQWFVILDSTNTAVSSFGIDEPLPLLDRFTKVNEADATSHIYKTNDSLYWTLAKTHHYANRNKVVYGFTLNLQKVHEYLSSIDVVTPNYAYIFDKQGLCIFHPDLNMIGQNVFDFSNITPYDTTQAGNSKNPPIVLSEYLNIETYQFIDHFQSDSFNGYISINFPKVNLDENLQPIKTTTYWIFIITVFLISSIFYLFNRANKKAYAEKELLAVENEKINKEKALVQLQQLKDQINPHFLFNSLNSLYMLVDLNPKEAKQFTLHLSKIYRYLIQPPVENIIPLEEELDFIKEYINLQRIRFRAELFFEVEDFEKRDLQQLIPYLGLQIAVENALKHNIATTAHPLTIKITKQDNSLVVTNNLQKKNNTEESGNFGHNYLKKIYAFYGESHFQIEETELYYSCKLPLLKHK